MSDDDEKADFWSNRTQTIRHAVVEDGEEMLSYVNILECNETDDGKLSLWYTVR